MSIKIPNALHNEGLKYKKLKIIEENKKYDNQREHDLRIWGYTVIRFKNDEVRLNIEKVLAEINSAVENSLQKSKSNS